MMRPDHRQEASEKAILYALLANFGIALAKSWGAWFTGSGSMLAEAIHSYADAGNQILLSVGLVQARKPAGLSIEEAVVRINALERRLKQQVPAIGWCFVEPDCVD